MSVELQQREEQEQSEEVKLADTLDLEELLKLQAAIKGAVEPTKPSEKAKPHFLYAGTLLIICFSCIGFFVWKEHQAAEVAKFKAKQALLLEEAKKEEAQEQRDKLDNCLYAARVSYEADWANACKSQANKVRENYQNCLNNGYLSESICKENWGKPDDSPSCTLLGNRADTVNGYYKDSKEECFKLYPVK